MGHRESRFRRTVEYLGCGAFPEARGVVSTVTGVSRHEVLTIAKYFRKLRVQAPEGEGHYENAGNIKLRFSRR
jgi:hypothetical protein